MHQGLDYQYPKELLVFEGLLYDCIELKNLRPLVFLASCIVNAVLGIVVSKPNAKKTTSLSGFLEAISSESIGE